MHNFIWRLVFRLSLSCMLAVGTFAASAQSADKPAIPTTNGVAFKAITAIDPVRHGELSAVLFYPSTTATQSTRIRPYVIQATQGAPAQSGQHPLIIISHGSGGSRWGHHALASYLAAHGFMVAALEHPGDNYNDSSGRGMSDVWYGRAAQVSALLDKIVSDATWGPLIDPRRIGFFGFSAGGYTGLMLGGASPNFRLVQQYCVSHRADASFCPFSTVPTPLKALKTADARFKAMVLAAPVGLIFEREALQDVKVPTLLMWGDEDQVLIPAYNAEVVARALPILAGQEVIHGAGHYVFISPCSSDLASIAPEICTDKAGIDRTGIHARLNAVIFAFFSNSLQT